MIKLRYTCFLLFFVTSLISCAPMLSVQKDAVKEKQGLDLFETFPEKYRLKAIEDEKKGELLKALLSWEVVKSFLPDDREASKKIDALKAQIRIEEQRHFQKGLTHFQSNSFKAARREFLIALSYNPENEKASYYLKHKLNDDGYLLYETKEGDTFRSIASEVYNDPDKDFLISYFNDINKSNGLKEGVMLKLPVIKSILMKKENGVYENQRLRRKSAFP